MAVFSPRGEMCSCAWCRTPGLDKTNPQKIPPCALTAISPSPLWSLWGSCAVRFWWQPWSQGEVRDVDWITVHFDLDGTLTRHTTEIRFGCTLPHISGSKHCEKNELYFHKRILCLFVSFVGRICWVGFIELHSGLNRSALCRPSSCNNYLYDALKISILAQHPLKNKHPRLTHTTP